MGVTYSTAKERERADKRNEVGGNAIVLSCADIQSRYVNSCSVVKRTAANQIERIPVTIGNAIEEHAER